MQAPRPQHEIAQEISTSASSITRFCHKLGYDNFKAMRFDLAPAADELAVDDFRRVMSWFTNSEDLVKNYLMGMAHSPFTVNGLM